MKISVTRHTSLSLSSELKILQLHVLVINLPNQWIIGCAMTRRHEMASERFFLIDTIC